MRAFFLSMFLLLTNLGFSQDSLKVLNGEFPSVNQIKLKIINDASYSLNYFDLDERKYQIKLFSYNKEHKFDSLVIFGSDPILRHSMIMDYFIDSNKLYLIARKNLIIYNLNNSKLIAVYPLKNEMNVIHCVVSEKIYMSLNFLFNPNDEKCSYAISYFDLATRKHSVKELNDYSSIALLSASPFSITFNGNNFFVSYLNDYIVDIYDFEFTKVGSIDNSSIFSNYKLYNYEYSKSIYNKKDLFYSIIENDDFKYPRMLGLQTLGIDTLIVVYKLPSNSDSTVKHVANLDLWIKDINNIWNLEFNSETSLGILPRYTRKSDFVQFKSSFVNMNQFVKYKTYCNNKEKGFCSSYSTYIFPSNKFIWNKIK